MEVPRNHEELCNKNFFNINEAAADDCGYIFYELDGIKVGGTYACSPTTQRCAQGTFQKYLSEKVTKTRYQSNINANAHPDEE